MAKKDGMFNIQFEELDKFLEEIEKIPDKIIEEMLREYTKYGMLVEEGTKALAPHDEGNLEGSISFSKAERDGDEVFIEGGSNLVYALRRHEEPPRMGLHDKYSRGAKFPDYYRDGRGLQTELKPSWRGESAGRKFLERAVALTEEDYNDMNEGILEKLLKGEE